MSEPFLRNYGDRILPLEFFNNDDTFITSVALPVRRRNYDRWSPTEEGVTLAWRDLNVYAKIGRVGKLCSREQSSGYKRIINNVSGAIQSGSLVALMGSSGTGKSTFMSSLAYRNCQGICVEGDILINGRPVGDYMRNLSGYVHQDDLFVTTLTVWEHMNIMARLKLDRRTSGNERREKIGRLLRYLGLWECAHTRIGGSGVEEKALSGGEKRRLALASELLTDPPLLFCDEPTTGLDSYSAQKIVGILNSMASSGKTVVCTIHQPSSQIFATFARLVLLADGRIVYSGSTSDAVGFFASLGYQCPPNYNPADFLIRTVATTPGYEDTSRQTVKRICDNFAVSEFSKEIDMLVTYEFHMGEFAENESSASDKNLREVFWWSRLSWLTYRHWLNNVRDRSLQMVRMAQKTAIALIIGTCFAGTTSATSQVGVQAVQGALFLFVTENTFNPMYSSLTAFPTDRPLFLREYKSGLYSVGTYYVSKVAATIPGLLMESIVFTSIAYWLAGLKASYDAFLATTLIVSLTVGVSTSCGIFFSNAFESVPSAMACLVPFDFLLMTTSGIFLKLSSLNGFATWVRYLSWLMYSTESLSIIQWSDVRNISCDISNADLPCLRNGSQVLLKYGFDERNLQRDLWCLATLCSLFYLLGFAILWKRTATAVAGRRCGAHTGSSGGL